MKPARRKGRVRKAARRALAWWQGRGTETCAHCSASYHYEMERRCVDCDRGVCAVCAVHVRESVYCPECD
jgi:hypothetical protein